MRQTEYADPIDFAQRVRTGVVVLEAIVALPILVICLLGLIQFGILCRVDQQVAVASRMGAKLAAEVSRRNSENPNLGNYNDPNALPSPPSGESLKERIDRFFENNGLTDSCSVILEHNVAGVANPSQQNPLSPAANCTCEAPVHPLPTGTEYVRVTVCLGASGNVPNVLRLFGLDLSSATITHSTVLPYEPREPGTAWAVGQFEMPDNPLILNEIGSGPIWNAQTTPGSGSGTLADVDFVSSSDGWAVGMDDSSGRPIVIHTADGGVTWAVQSTPISNGNFKAVDFVNDNQGWLVGVDQSSGNSGVVLNTSNGGGTWSLQSPPAIDELRGIDFIDATNGWVVGRTGGAVSIINTSDGGLSWNDISPANTGTSSHLNGVDFVDAASGWVTGGVDGNGLILAVSFNGANWSATAQAIPFAVGELHAVDFINPTVGWSVGEEIVGGITQTVILSTNDGGANWSRQAHPSRIGTLFHVDFIDDQTGYAVGVDESNGATPVPMILKTSDGGASWVDQVSQVRRGRLFSVSAGVQLDE